MSGFWRRIAAFLADLFILGLVGWSLGLVLTEQFVALGPWGRAVGFVIAFAYFGVLNSRVTGGQTPGKKLLRVRVVDRDARPLGLGRSLLRFLPLGIPFFLNNAQFSSAVLLSPLMYPLAVAVFGLGLSLLYLYVFNRMTRQSLHDLLVGSYVIPASDTAAPQASPWRGHYVVTVALLAATAVLPYFTRQLTANLPWSQLLAVIQTAEDMPWVIHSQASMGVTSTVDSDGTKKTTSFEVNATIRDADIASEERAAQLAAVVFEKVEGAESYDLIGVALSYGYDIGIATMWSSHNHVYSPTDWRAKLAKTDS